MRASEKSFYDALRQAGAGDSEKVGFSAAGQRARFSMIFRVVECLFPNWRETSLVDVGCGLGALFPFLKEHGFAGDYLGLDALGQSVADARWRYPRARFAEQTAESWTGRAPVVVSSGLFSTRSEEEMRGLFLALLAQSDQVSVHNFLRPASGVAFRPENVLTSPDVVRRWVDPVIWETLLVEDYLPHDFTIGVRRRSAHVLM